MRWLVPVVIAAACATTARAQSEPRLEAAWRTFHASEEAPPPRCGDDDAVRAVSGDFDRARPGDEIALASLRWGVAIFSGERAIAWKALGCDPQQGGAVLALEAVKTRPGQVDLAVRARRAGHCGVVVDWTLFDAALKPLLSIDEEVDRVCGGVPEEHRRARVTVGAGVVRAGSHEWRWDGAKFTDSAADRRRP